MAETKTKKITAIVIGAGNRGTNYAQYGLEKPDQFQVIGVADPVEFRRRRIADPFKIPAENRVEDWKEFAKRPKFADVAIVTTQDQMHKEPAIAFANLGYHILLEKPMAVTIEDCQAITEACEKNEVQLCVCHVLRYTPINKKIKELILDDKIGKVVNIQHKEPVGYYHFAHSFVRGNWRREDESTFALLAKCCHDVDLVRYWMGEDCSQVASFGALTHFKSDNAPEGSSDRCVSCPKDIESSCPYSALKIYYSSVCRGNTGWPVSVVVDDANPDKVMKALESGPYGRCVYKCDNDVVDHQVVNMQFESGATASLTMVAFTDKICQRETHVYGTHGEISCVSSNSLRYTNFRTGQTKVIDVPSVRHTRLSGHGGADYHLMDSFVSGLLGETPIETNGQDTLKSHELVFYAEEARTTNSIVKIPTQIQSATV